MDAAQMLRAIVKDDQAPPGDRIKAAEIVFDRVLGKPRESIELDFAGQDDPAPWQTLMAQAIVSSLDQAVELENGEEVVDGEVVEEQPSKPEEPGLKRPHRRRAAVT